MGDGVLLLLLVLFAASRTGGAAAPASGPSAPRELPPSPPPVKPKPARKRGGARWSDDDLREFIRIGTGLGLSRSDLEDVLLLFAVESRLDPAAKRSNAWGLMQAQLPLLREVGWKAEPAAFASLKVQRQLPWVAKMLEVLVRRIMRKPDGAADWLRLNLSPVAARKQSEIVYSRQKDPSFYAANATLDVNADGAITMSDLRAHTASVASQPLYTEHLARLRAL